MVSTSLSGSTRILYVFPRPITLSTWVLLLEILLSSFSLRGGSWFIFLTKVGMLTLTSYGAAMSWMLKPLSAITESFGSHFCKRLLRCTRIRSLADPRPVARGGGAVGARAPPPKSGGFQKGPHFAWPGCSSQ